MSACLVIIVLATISTLVKDIINQGLYVWNRDNLGHLLQKLIFHVCVLAFFVRVYQYVSIKE